MNTLTIHSSTFRSNNHCAHQTPCGLKSLTNSVAKEISVHPNGLFMSSTNYILLQDKDFTDSPLHHHFHNEIIPPRHLAANIFRQPSHLTFAFHRNSLSKSRLSPAAPSAKLIPCLLRKSPAARSTDCRPIYEKPWPLPKPPERRGRTSLRSRAMNGSAGSPTSRKRRPEKNTSSEPVRSSSPENDGP